MNEQLIMTKVIYAESFKQSDLIRLLDAGYRVRYYYPESDKSKFEVQKAGVRARRERSKEVSNRHNRILLDAQIALLKKNSKRRR